MYFLTIVIIFDGMDQYNRGINMKLRKNIMLFVTIGGAVTLILVAIILVNILVDNTSNSIGEHALDMAKIISERQEVIKGFRHKNPSIILDPIADDLIENTKADFVVFMNMNSKRHSHPNKDLIGKYFTGGDEDKALNGEQYHSRAEGISGPSIRGFSPITNEDGEQMGAVAVGFFQPSISEFLGYIYRSISIVIPIGMLVIIILSYLLSKNIKKKIFGLEPHEIARILKERAVTLDSMREGLIVVNKNAEITILNKSAKYILDIGDDVIGKKIRNVIQSTRLPVILEKGKPEYDQRQIIKNKVIITNRIPLVINNRVVGAIATFRNRDEVNKLAEEITGFKEIIAALRARTHEYVNKLHAISGLIQLGHTEEAIDLVNEERSNEEGFLKFLFDNIKNTTVAGLLMGKSSEAQEKDIDLEIKDDCFLAEDLPDYFNEHDIVVVLGNLIENAVEALKNVENEYKKIKVLIKQSSDMIEIEVENNGPPISKSLKNKIFEKGFTTKKKGKGLGLAKIKSYVKKTGGAINVKTNQNWTSFYIQIPLKKKQ